MSKVSKLIAGFGGLALSGWLPKLDGVAVTLTGKSISGFDSLKDRAVEGSLSYTGADGVPHVLGYQTKQENDGSDVVSIDGVKQVNAVVDVDIHWESVTVQFRYNDANGAAHQFEITETVGLFKALELAALGV